MRAGHSSGGWTGLLWMAIFVVLVFFLQGQMALLLQAYVADRLVWSPLSWFLAVLPVTLILPRPEHTGVFSGVGLSLARRHRVYLAVGVAAGGALSGGIVLIQTLAGWLTFGDEGEAVSWAQDSAVATLALSLLMFAVSAAGEELLLRGYGFQQLSRLLSPVGAACAAGLMFGLMHSRNPNVSGLAVVNTAGFGLVFGLALARHRSLWLPFGLHLGWNLMLGILGVRISGLTISIFGFTSTSQGSALWSGGHYGPEATVLTTASVAVVLWIVWRVPMLEDSDRLIWDKPDEPIEKTCESSSKPLHSPSPSASPLTQTSTTRNAKRSSET